MIRTSSIWIGTSNLVLRETKSNFPGEHHASSRLRYYSGLFNSVEINSTFYRLHRPSTFESWSNDVDNGFTFSVKLWREITHAKGLAFREEDVHRCLSTWRFSVQTKGGLLVQFPASVKVSQMMTVERMLALIQRNNSNGEWRVCVEFRDKGWYNSEVFSMLSKHGVSLVMHDMPKSGMIDSKADFPTVYLRFHGVNGDYRGSYDRHYLDEIGDLIKDWALAGKYVYVYFNNTLGTAYEDARYLASLRDR
ncbi:MAG TPA: DUF72 domain-containing protein [Chryseolinea sp.]|nr:DUF72 domain-containing protein [Chryseolinea sp.]